MDQTSRFRIRIKTLLFVFVFVALVTVVIMQQVQIERLRRSATRAIDMTRVMQKGAVGQTSKSSMLPPSQLGR